MKQVIKIAQISSDPPPYRPTLPAFNRPATSTEELVDQFHQQVYEKTQELLKSSMNKANQ